MFARKLFTYILLITTFAIGAQAAEKARIVAIRTSPKGEVGISASLKNLPLILDTKNFKIEKLKNVKVESFNLDKAFGPGSSGGGNICAFNITSASAFIVKNIDKIPFANKNQRNQFLAKMTSVRFLQGANLEVRGQSVNAINVPSANVIVLDEKACEAIGDGGSAGYSLLLHEYLGVASIDDMTYQVSNAFAAATQKEMNVGTCETAHCIKLKAELKLYRVSLEKLENDLAFGDRISGTDLKYVFSKDKKGKKVKNVRAAIAELKRQIKADEFYAWDECEGGCNSAESALDQAEENKLELASIYREEITRLLAEIADNKDGDLSEQDRKILEEIVENKDRDNEEE